jgi:hypothetical protein
VVLVSGLAVVAAVLLVPPVVIRIALCSVDRRGVDVATVLRALAGKRVRSSREADHVGVGELDALGFGHGGAGLLEELRSAGEGGRQGAGERAGRCNAPREHAGRRLGVCAGQLEGRHT